jgi:hypothetical protein
MKSQTDKQKSIESTKPRFQIEKLEERIAPHHNPGHEMGPHKGGVGGGHGGNCGRGNCGGNR